MNITDGDRTRALTSFLDLAVPVEMMRWRDATPEQIEAARAEAAQIVAERGDVIQFKSKGTAESTASLVRGLAVLALTSPGGVTFAGQHWCSVELDCLPTCANPRRERAREHCGSAS